MSTYQERNLVACLDIGTSTISCIIGEVFQNSEVEILGYAKQPSKGMDKGGVNQLDIVVNNLKLVLSEVEIQANVSVNAVNLSISGQHIHCQNEKGMLSIDGDEITQEDINYVIHTARSIKIPTDRIILHVLAQDFTVDELEGIQNPLGMSAMRLEVNVHIITASSDWVRNIKKCVERCDIEVENIVFSGFASSYSVLTDDEKELGVCLVDIGAGTTDISIIASSVMQYSEVLPIAGNQVTNDIAKIFRTPISEAEKMKIASSVLAETSVDQEQIEVPSLGGRPSRKIFTHNLYEVIEPRYIEIFEHIYKVIAEKGFVHDIASGIVFTGGAVQIKDLTKLAEHFFGMPVRIGKVKTVSQKYKIETPDFATAVGLLLYGAELVIERQYANNQERGVKKWFASIQGFFRNQF